MDFRKKRRTNHDSVFINGEAAETFSSFERLGVNITEGLRPPTLGRHDGVSFFCPQGAEENLQVNLYRGTAESFITHCVTAWFASCSTKEPEGIFEDSERRRSASLGPGSQQSGTLTSPAVRGRVLKHHP